jgi:hypothetical protein
MIRFKWLAESTPYSRCSDGVFGTCHSPKCLLAEESMTYSLGFGAPSAITLAHGQPVFALVRSTRSPFFVTVGNLYWRISRCGNSSAF